jgi:hypothetical protein
MAGWAYSMAGGSRYSRIYMEKCLEKQYHEIWKVDVKIDFGEVYFGCVVS